MRIALFVGQIYLYTQREVIRGIYEECKRNHDELHLFSFYVSTDEKFDLGEYEYIRRMDLSGFDGFILYASAFYNPRIRRTLVNKVKEAGKPCVSIDSYDEDFINVTSCSKDVMGELVEHLITDHGVKKVNYVGGPEDSVDAQDRLDACRDVLRSHGYELPDERIYYGNYYLDSGYKAYEYFRTNNMMDADAFVCVNDQNAMGIFYRLRDDGYKVPDDYIITGFDNIPQASYNIPSITSVKRYENEIGHAAYRGLKEGKDDMRIEPKVVRGASCCRDCVVDNNKREDYLSEFIKFSMDSARYSGFVNESAADFMAYRSVDEMFEILPDYQRKFNIPTMSIVIDRGKRRKLLDVPYHYNIETGEMKSMVISKNEIFGCEGCGNLYIYSSLHYGDTYYGYLISTNYPEATEYELYHMFVTNISNMLESAQRHNDQEDYISRLQDLSYYDPLTKLYNRHGFFKKADTDFEECKKDGRDTYIIFADLDRLKVINDTMGHKMGDEYIVDFSQILTECTSGNDIVMRFGGDEFVVFGKAVSAEEVTGKIKRIQDEIRVFNERGKYSPYILGASLGYTMIPHTTDKTLFSFMEEADGKMYKAKQAKKEKRSGKDRRSGRDRRVNDRRSINDPLNFT